MSNPFIGMVTAALSDDAIGNAFLTGLILLVVVFAALVVLAFIIWLFGRMSGDNKAPSVPRSSVPRPVPAPTPAKAAKPTSAVASVANGEDEDEVAAVIAAAVAMMAPEGVTYKVRRITPVGRAARPAWAAAAVRQNTAPF